MTRTSPPVLEVARTEAPLPPEAALACEAAGAAKAGRDAVALMVLGFLAGAFIALGAVFMTVVLSGTGDLAWGVARLLGGLVFSLGLILVIVGGAELFTGDSLMIVACASGRISLAALLRAWSLVYAGNIAGAVGTAALVFCPANTGSVAAASARRPSPLRRPRPRCRRSNCSSCRCCATCWFAWRCGCPSPGTASPTRSW